MGETYVPTRKIVVPPAKKENLSRRGCLNVPPVIGSLPQEVKMFFIRVACGYGLRRYFPAHRVAITVSFAN